MKTFELKQEIETKTKEMAAKIEARDVENAKTLKKEIDDLRDLLTMQEEQEAREMRELESQKKNSEGDKVVDEFRALVKKVMGKELTEEERTVVKTTDNAPVVPKQFVNQLQELQKGFGALRGYCDIIPVTKNEGTIPVIDLDQNEMKDIAEGADIVDGTLVTTDISFKCTKVGLKQNLSSELIEDAEVEIESLAKKNFVNISTAKENFKIMKVLKDAATVVAPTKSSYLDVMNIMDTALPSVKAGLATYTNTQGFAYLKNLTDKNDRPLNLVTEINGKYYFNGKELISVDDTLLAPKTVGNKIFIVANAKEAVKFMDRKATTIERWRKPDNDTWNISILERLDVVKGSARSVKSVEF